MIKRLPCAKGFASVRSTLAGVAETGLICECARPARALRALANLLLEKA